MLATSSHTELRLVNVARASLDELLLDYEDFLRQRGKRLWGKDDREARAVRAVGWQQEKAASFNPSDPAAQLRANAEPMSKNPYGQYLLRMLED